jgi:Zn-dependent protease
VDKVESFLVVAPVLLFSMVAHEYAHGYAALRQGDPTAYQLGRLTWNPVKHIDPFMTVILPLMTFFLGGFIFGGAKPVPVNPRNYKNFRRGDIIVSLAGVVTNLVLAGVFTVLIALLGVLGRAVPVAAATLGILQYMLLTGVFFNLVLVFFNLIPIPPLDGSHVVKYLLPPAWSLRYQQIGMYGMFILIALLTVGRPVLSAWLSPMYSIFSSAQRVVVPYMLPSPLLAPL